MELSRAAVVMVVAFRSRLTADEVRRKSEERMPAYRAVPGLLEKYYVLDESSGEWGGVFLWDSPESMERFLASELRESIRSAYEIEGAPRITTLSVLDALRS